MSLLEHQCDMPTVPPPEEVSTDLELWSKWLTQIPKLPNRLRDYIQMRINEPLPFEFKPLNRTEYKHIFKPEKSMVQYVWLRARGRLPDDHAFHHLAAAYVCLPKLHICRPPITTCLQPSMCLTAYHSSADQFALRCINISDITFRAATVVTIYSKVALSHNLVP